jgi:DNA (cytosine-5)-methyltransferase 1
MLTVGSLFAGIGGLELGLERAGMTVKWQVEWDDYCTRVLEKHWPDVKRYSDVHDVGAHNLEPVDLICGGFPCQPVSVAGKQKGQDDDRWLWPEFARIVRELRPRYVLAENVPGLLIRGMGDVLGDLSALGYDAEWESIPAAAVGAPHLRYRVFILAYRNGGRCEVEREQEHAAEQSTRGSKPDGLCAGRRRDGETLADANGGCGSAPGTTHWSVEPDVGRVAHGVPARVDRLRALGNAVVPQVAEWIGRRILDVANLDSDTVG